MGYRVEICIKNQIHMVPQLTTQHLCSKDSPKKVVER